ncbi:MAG TPA: aminotransferase class I/II-fold pyridoxal phosphate-dependent enzyme [Anaeromyxobacteraceae bacterium]|nr:aminotransferase class I/II-fold pyridoxal phosphate-dependent enzyme [Anaeromyxobacteraceae bacterium]
MALKIAKRSDTPPFIVMEVMNEAAKREASGGDVLHMEVGQPNTPAPELAREAAVRAIRSDLLGYTLALGDPALRARIARYYRERHGVEVPVERIAVTAGSLGAFQLAFLAAFDAGDRVAMANPGYPSYRNALKPLGVEVVSIPCGPETHYQPTPDLLEAAGPLDGLIVASPSNPTGSILSRERLEALVRHCERHRIRLISDEIYHGLTYGGPATSASELSSDAVVVNSFSKYYSMAGWRLGWMIMPEELARPIERLAQNFFICPSAVAQAAARVAFDATQELEGHVARYARARDILLEALPRLGFGRIAPPDGAFYIYADVSHLTRDSVAFCRRLLAETGIAATPGLDFDPERGSATIRLSYARGPEVAAAAVERLSKWLPARGPARS